MNIWLPTFLYRLKPVIYTILAILLFSLIPGIGITLIAMAIICYSGWICWMRLQWQDADGIK